MSRVSKNIRLLSRTAKLRIFSFALLAAVIFVVCSDNIAFSSFKETDNPRVQIKSAIDRNIPLRSVREEKDNVGGETTKMKTTKNPFVPPTNATGEERIAWLQRKLPEFEIFKSDRVTRQFHSRVLQFFNPGCEVRVFMTWISPATSFGSRELLAVDSLFKAHPYGCLMILSRTLDTIRGYRVLKPLIDRRFKVHAVTPDLSFLFNSTPAGDWLDDIKKGNKDPGEIPLAQNLSNLMRLAILYKYGGVYLDTDFVILKPLTGLRNSIGAQSIDVGSKNWTRLNNAVLIFDMNHPLLLKFIEEFALTFDGNRWGHNGPYLVSRVVERLETKPEFNPTVLPPMAFYPVDWTKIAGLFKKPENEAQLRWVKAKLLQLSGETYGVHLWNRQSGRLVIEEGSIMGRLISDHCVICRDIYSSQNKFS